MSGALVINDLEVRRFRRTGNEPFLPKFVTRQHQAELTAAKIKVHKAKMEAMRAKHAKAEAERQAKLDSAKAEQEENALTITPPVLGFLPPVR